MQAVIAAQAAIHAPPRSGGTIGGQESGGRLESPTHAEISEVEP